jgi:hypothetical protein
MWSLLEHHRRSIAAPHLRPLFADCLAKLGLVAPSDLVAVGTKVFPCYLTVARKLQRKYGLGA